MNTLIELTLFKVEGIINYVRGNFSICELLF